MTPEQVKVILTAEDRTAAAFSSANRLITKMGVDFDGLGLKAAQALGGIVSIAGITAAVKSTADYADEIGKLAQKAGSTTEEVSKLAYAARQADVDNEQLAKGLRALGADAQSGGEKLAELGIKTTDASGKTKSSADLFRELADAISSIDNPQQKAALAAELLGEKIGPALIPLLNQGAAGLKEMGDEAQRFGRVVTDDASKSAEELNDNLTKLSEIGSGLAAAIGNRIIPVVADLSSYFLSVARDAGIARAALITFGAVTARVVGLDDVGKVSSAAKANQNAIALTVKQIETFQRLADRGVDGAADRVAALRQQYDQLQSRGQKITADLKKQADDIYSEGAAAGERSTSKVPDRPIRSSGGRSRSAASAGKDPILQANEREADMRRLLGKIEDEEIKKSLDAAKLRRESAIDELEMIDRRNTAYQNYLQTLQDATPTGQLEKQRETMAMLAEEYERGRFGAVGSAEAFTQYSEVVNTFLGQLDTGVKTVNQTAEAVGSIFGTWLERSLSDGLKFKDFIAGLTQDLIKLAIQKQVIEPAVRGVTGGVGDLFTLFSGFNTYDGGGYTGSGARSGGVDGKGGFMAVLHPQETVIDHTKGQGMGGASVVLNYTIDARGADPGSEARMEQALKASEARTKSDILASIGRGGVWSRAVGRV